MKQAISCPLFEMARCSLRCWAKSKPQGPDDFPGRAFAVKVEGKRLPVSTFPGFDVYHHFRNDAFYDLYNLLKIRKTGKREVVFLQPLPQTL
jgi:hypothetical protein